MKKYEYKIAGLKSNKSADVMTFFNELGAEGWKLCTGDVKYNEGCALAYNLTMCVFRRKIKKRV